MYGRKFEILATIGGALIIWGSAGGLYWYVFTALNNTPEGLVVTEVSEKFGDEITWDESESLLSGHKIVITVDGDDQLLEIVDPDSENLRYKLTEITE